MGLLGGNSGTCPSPLAPWVPEQGEIPRDGELSKPVLRNAGPRQGARLWSVVALHQWLRQLLQPLEFALKTASDGAVLWCRARGQISPGSQGLSPAPELHTLLLILGGWGCLHVPCACSHAGCSPGPSAVLSPHGISPGIAAALHRLFFPLAGGKI